MRSIRSDGTKVGEEHGSASLGKHTVTVQRTAASAARATTPGKHTLTMSLPSQPSVGAAPPVQVKAQGAADSDTQGDVHAAAQEGIAGPGGSLPFLDRIQRLFGRHDVTSVRAHQDERSAAGAQAMGADAFATGNHVAFAGSPSLHTAAHEAAHVIQQRGGVQLRSSVGLAGDAYERHADQVADAVVAGKPAEELLSEIPRGGTVSSESPVQRKDKLGSGDDAFNDMWDAHPHNYQDDESQNTSSDDVRDNEGLPAYMDNTCAIRISVMLNATGHQITPATAKAAGLARKPHYSKKTKQYYIIGAAEMWQYLEKHFRKEDVSFPTSGRYKDEAAFQAEFDSTIKPIVAARKGIAGFDRIFGFAGTGHVDLFDGESLSDAPNWYPCQKLRLWYIVVPQAGP